MTGAPGGSPVEPPVRTVFFGSGGFALPILDAVVAHPGLALAGVVSVPDRPRGRHGAPVAVPVVARARELGLSILQPDGVRAPATADAVASLQPGLGVLADFGRIVPQAILALPAHGFLNVHPSALPRHRGASPVPSTILSGDAEAGVSIMAMDAGLDTGPVVAARLWPLVGDETAPALEAEAARRGAELLAEVVGSWLAGAIEPRPQDDSVATLTRPLRREDGRLDPELSAVELERRVRAFAGWPGTFIDTPGGRLIVRRATVAPGAPGDRVGELLLDGDRLALVTNDGRLHLLEVQPASGRPMDGGAWLRGRGRGLAAATVSRG